MMKTSISQTVAQVTPVSTRRDLSRAQYGSCQRDESAANRAAKCLSDLHPIVHWDLRGLTLAR